MPANLTPQYHKAEKEYREAKTIEEKIACLENMLVLIPKHKGTDHMQADLKRKLSQLREQSESGGGKGKRAPVFKVEKEGAGQIALLGGPNAGKSLLLSRLTNANALVADYPFTTHAPQPGMAQFEDIHIQLVDMPPITEDYMESWMPDIVRRADGVMLVADMGDDDGAEALEVIVRRLEKVKVNLVPEIPAEAANLPGNTFRRTRILANKMDLPDATLRLEFLREHFAGRFEVWPISALMGTGLDTFPEKLFQFLGIIRVYTKEPGKKPDMEKPYVVPSGSTVVELAIRVHRDFEQSLKSARIWGSGKYEGLHVKRDHVLSDRDVIELHE
jgi:uncharacterized protein